MLSELGHQDPETFAMARPVRGPRRATYASIERILFELLRLARAQLAAQKVHVGHTVLELAVFNAMRDGSSDPVADIVASVRSQRLHEPGFVLYPLFGFGLLNAPDTSLMDSRAVEIIDGAAGIAVTSRRGDTADLQGFLDRAMTGLGVVGALPKRDINHFVAMRGVTGWLLTNPLLLVRIRSISMGARENQSAYLRAIGHRATLLGLASALAKPRSANRLLAGSTQAASNQDTLDFRHYFVFESPGDANKPLRTDRISMGPRRAPLVQLADLHVDVDPAAWRTPGIQATIGALTDALLDLEDLQASVAGGAAGPLRKENVSRKLSTSLHWARRSFAAFADPREAVVAMAVAFEALLSDGYSNGVTKTIVERARSCLAQQRAPAALGDAVQRLFDGRGAIVHKGEAQTDTDLRLARHAFAHCFIVVVRRIVAASPTSTLVLANLFP